MVSYLQTGNFELDPPNQAGCFIGVFGDVPHIKTGATALHVAAAKGYIKVISLLLQAGAQVNIQVGVLINHKFLYWGGLNWRRPGKNEYDTHDLKTFSVFTMTI